MKKHELLKYAYDNYPKGTVARFGGKLPDHVSTGKFEITDLNHNGEIQVMSDNGLECFYADGEWAEIIPEKQPSILDGKVAIYCKNYREYLLTAKHLDSIGKRSNIVKEEYFENKPIWISVENQPVFWSSIGEIRPEDNGYSIIPFADFAKEVGITVPVFILKSEDGVDLYEGDQAHHVFQGHGSLGYGGLYNIKHFLLVGKAFSTKKAAESWIEEQNKPREIEIIHNDNETSHVSKDQIKIRFSDKGSIDYIGYLTPKAIEQIWEAYQSLQ